MKITDLSERVQSKIALGPLFNGAPCWEWIGSVKKNGYGRVYRRVDGKRHYILAHRHVYEKLVGPVPPGLQIDHLCRNRKCVNPAHMEAVTQRVNTLRGEAPAAQNARRTECVNGHPFEGDNLVRLKDGRRRCRQCSRDRARRYAARRRSVLD